MPKEALRQAVVVVAVVVVAVVVGRMQGVPGRGRVGWDGGGGNLELRMPRAPLRQAVVVVAVVVASVIEVLVVSEAVAAVDVALAVARWGYDMQLQGRAQASDRSGNWIVWFSNPADFWAGNCKP